MCYICRKEEEEREERKKKLNSIMARTRKTPQTPATPASTLNPSQSSGAFSESPGATLPPTHTHPQQHPLPRQLQRPPETGWLQSCFRYASSHHIYVEDAASGAQFHRENATHGTFSMQRCATQRCHGELGMHLKELYLASYDKAVGSESCPICQVASITELFRHAAAVTQLVVRILSDLPRRTCWSGLVPGSPIRKLCK